VLDLGDRGIGHQLAGNGEFVIGQGGDKTLSRGDGSVVVESEWRVPVKVTLA
jgi:hypothetical protein